MPLHLPSMNNSFPVQSIKAIEHINSAFLSFSLTSFNFSRSFSLFLSSFPCSPAYLAEKTPGYLFKYSTSSPESSAITIKSFSPIFIKYFLISSAFL